ncbi:hypothetical protein LSUE1_G001384 [Lachnellula suecica]|uniref:NAD(P)-binding domain-containing protein n=1 Tax=Lachnellula suecica TaxID=602035 RepID=A0A8T9CIR8_9HELO|nr:hypothetical protein LSUE1_G001384 [Lachnellula suecica]
MKVILAGSTGFIGREVLAQCIRNPSISSIVALSRSELKTVDPKLRVSIIKDFTAYSDSVLQDIKDADACIWCLGKNPRTEINEARKACVDYTTAALRAITPKAIKKEGWKFRFIYLSGAAAERDQEKALWFSTEYRRMRGQVENIILAHAEEYRSTMEAVIMRPGFVLAKEQSIRDTIRGLGPSVRVDVLAQAMIASALNGSKIQIADNAEINRLGAE